MAGGVFVIQKDGNLVEMKETPFKREDDFQKLLATHPNLLAGDQMNENAPRRWLLIGREVAVPDEDGGAGRWSLDHLFLDQEMIPTLVEIKRSRDNRIRREVVGQLLDYAANATINWSVEELRSRFERRCETGNVDPSAAINDLVQSEMEADLFWQKVKTNLQAGKVRLVFMADSIPPELRRIVEFLNEQMDPAEVLAVELRRYTGGGISTLVPRVLGLTEKAKRKTTRFEPRPSPWTPEDYLQSLRLSKAPNINLAERLIGWAKKMNLGIRGGTGPKTPRLYFEESGVQLFALDELGGVPQFRVYFDQIPAPFDQGEAREELIGRLNSIGGINLPLDVQFKGFRLSAVEESGQLEALLETLDWAMEAVRTS